MRKMKFIAVMILLMMIPAVLSGCWDMVEINDRLCVRGMGLDTGSREDMIKVTFQMLVPHETNDTEGTPVYQTMTVEASTISEAVAYLAENVEQQVHFEHLSAIVLGSVLAQQRPLEVMDYFHRTSQVRRNAEVAVVMGKAQSLLEASISGGGVGEYVETMIKTHETEDGPSVQPSALSRLFVYRANGEDFYLPVLTYAPGEEQKEGETGGQGKQDEKAQKGEASPAQELTLAGAYLYDGVEFSGMLDAGELELLRLLQGKTEHITVTLSQREGLPGRMAFRVEKLSNQMQCRTEADHFSFPMQIRAECVFQEAMGKLPEDTQELYDRMEKALEKHITQMVEVLISHVRREGADVMGFEKLVRQSRHAWYQAHRDRWPDYFENAHIPVEVQVTLRRGGYLE